MLTKVEEDKIKALAALQEDRLIKNFSHHKLQITISCRNLKDMDLIGKSDPYAVLYARDKNEDQWKRIGRTETIHENANPDF